MDAEKRELIEENRRLRARVEELEGMVRALQEQVQVLTAALEESRRAGKRQAAPFRKPQRVEKPKKPGRKPGEQYGRTRPTHRAGECLDRRTTRRPVAAGMPEVRLAASGRR